MKLVKSSNLDTVSFLCTLPNSKHDASSFVIDIPFCGSNFIIVVVNGLYTEIYKANNPLRSFCRTFYIVPQSPGFVIVNDMLSISNPSVSYLNIIIVLFFSGIFLFR